MKNHMQQGELAKRYFCLYFHVKQTTCQQCSDLTMGQLNTPGKQHRLSLQLLQKGGQIWHKSSIVNLQEIWNGLFPHIINFRFDIDKAITQSFRKIQANMLPTCINYEAEMKCTKVCKWLPTIPCNLRDTEGCTLSLIVTLASCNLHHEEVITLLQSTGNKTHGSDYLVHFTTMWNWHIIWQGLDSLGYLQCQYRVLFTWRKGYGTETLVESPC